MTASGRKQAQYQKSQRREGQLEIGVQEAHKRRPVLVLMRCLSWQRQYIQM